MSPQKPSSARKTPVPQAPVALEPEVEDLNVGDSSEPGPDAKPLDPEVPKSRTSEDATGSTPKWLTMEPFTARLRGDQVEGLTALRRQVARQRQDKQERLTPNTLVRIAIDLLLAHGDKLKGDTEQQLLASLVPENREAKS